MDLLKSFFEVQVFLLFFSLIYGHNAEIQSLHETPGCEHKIETPGLFSTQPGGKLRDSQMPVSEKMHRTFFHSLCLCSLFLQEGS